MLVRFVPWHVFDVSCHPPHVGLVAPVAHEDVLVCVIEPVCPDGHERVWVCGESGVQVGDAGVQDALV